MSDLRISMYRSEGSYNWANERERQALIVISFPLNGKLEKMSACVEIGGEYDIAIDGDTEPEEVVMTIRNFYDKGVWISTEKPRIAELAKAYFDNKTSIDLIWYQQKIGTLRSQIESLEKKIKSTENAVKYLKEEIAAAEAA